MPTTARVATGAIELAPPASSRAPDRVHPPASGHPPGSRVPSATAGAAALWLAVAAVFAVGAVPVYARPLNHDPAWFLYVAERVLGGARLYVDVVEVNPPLVVWLNAPVIWVARATGLGVAAAYHAAVSLLVVASLLRCAAPLRAALPGAPARRAAALLALAFALSPLVGGEFGQREHLMMALVLPYLVLAAARASGHSPATWRAAATGALAGVGFSLKPYFAPLWLAVEAYLALRPRAQAPRVRALRAESVAVAAVAAAYALLVVLLTPQYFAMARIMWPLYSAFRVMPLRAMLPPLVPVACAAGVWALARRRASERALGDLAAIAAAVLAAAYVAQRKGFTYHLYPPRAAALLLLAVAASGALAERAEGEWRLTRASLARVATAAVASALAVALFLPSWEAVRAVAHPRADARSYDSFARRPLYQIVERYAAGGDVLFLSAELFPAFPIVTYTHARWASRFPQLWFLQALYDVPHSARPPYRSAVEMSPLERALRDAVVEDALRARPALVVADLRPPFSALDGRPFNFLAYYSQDPRFARLSGEYEVVPYDGRYRVFRRIAPGASARPRP